jgi:hypothetical protein
MVGDLRMWLGREHPATHAKCAVSPATFTERPDYSVAPSCLAIWEFVPIVVLLAFWRAPDWILKVLATAEAVRRFRQRRYHEDQDESRS